MKAHFILTVLILIFATSWMVSYVESKPNYSIQVHPELKINFNSSPGCGNKRNFFIGCGSNYCPGCGNNNVKRPHRYRHHHSHRHQHHQGYQHHHQHRSNKWNSCPRCGRRHHHFYRHQNMGVILHNFLFQYTDLRKIMYLYI